MMLKSKLKPSPSQEVHSLDLLELVEYLSVSEKSGREKLALIRNSFRIYTNNILNNRVKFNITTKEIRKVFELIPHKIPSISHENGNYNDFTSDFRSPSIKDKIIKYTYLDAQKELSKKIKKQDTPPSSNQLLKLKKVTHKKYYERIINMTYIYKRSKELISLIIDDHASKKAASPCVIGATADKILHILFLANSTAKVLDRWDSSLY